jgi:uncharacterized protein
MASHPSGRKVGRPLNPARLDVAELAQRSGPFEGDWPLAAMARLRQPGEPEPDPLAKLHWHATAEHRPVSNGAPELWLHLSVCTTVLRTCQRCLQAMAVPLALHRHFLFAPNEAQAEAWDAERDDADVLVLTRSLNLLELAEDEVLLALPIVPRHEVCPQPLVAPSLEARTPTEVSPEEVDRDNPFAILAQLKRRH